MQAPAVEAEKIYGKSIKYFSPTFPVCAKINLRRIESKNKLLGLKRLHLKRSVIGQFRFDKASIEKGGKKFCPNRPSSFVGGRRGRQTDGLDPTSGM